MAGTFTLDTSGEVVRFPQSSWPEVTRWPDLDAFTQGYGEAMARALYDALISEGWSRADAERAVSFANWAPETLARILKDCEAWSGRNPGFNNRAGGGFFWRTRQDGERTNYPPQAPYLGEDGLAYLREAA